MTRRSLLTGRLKPLRITGAADKKVDAYSAAMPPAKRLPSTERREVIAVAVLLK